MKVEGPSPAAESYQHSTSKVLVPAQWWAPHLPVPGTSASWCPHSTSTVPAQYKHSIGVLVPTQWWAPHLQPVVDLLRALLIRVRCLEERRRLRQLHSGGIEEVQKGEEKGQVEGRRGKEGSTQGTMNPSPFRCCRSSDPRTLP